VLIWKTSKELTILTCAKLRTGWSVDDAVEEADGEAVRDGVGDILQESSSSADSFPADSEAVTEDG